jgi:hypothetical protein
MRRLVPAIALACTVDLRVGSVDPIDAIDVIDSIDAIDAGTGDGSDPASFDAGIGLTDAGLTDAGPSVHRFDVGDQSMVQCADSLGGREADFAAFRAADFGLASGDLSYERSGGMLVLSGPLLIEPFETSRIVLEDGLVPDQPIGTYLAAVPIQTGVTGPHDTRVNLAAIYIDVTLATTRGEAGFEFETASTDGACFVSFTIAIDP